MNPHILYHLYHCSSLCVAACSTLKFRIWGTNLIYDLINPFLPHSETWDHQVLTYSYAEKYVTSLHKKRNDLWITSHISMKMSPLTKNAVTHNSGLLDYLVPSFSPSHDDMCRKKRTVHSTIYIQVSKIEPCIIIKNTL